MDRAARAGPLPREARDLGSARAAAAAAYVCRPAPGAPSYRRPHAQVSPTLRGLRRAAARHLRAVRSRVRDRRRRRRGSGRLDPGRRRRPDEPRVRVPEGHRDARSPRGPRPAAKTSGAVGRRPSRGDLGGGAARGRGRAASRPQGARRRRRRRLPGQPGRAQPRPAHGRADRAALPRHQEPVLGVVLRSGPADARGRAHVRQPGAHAGARSRAHRPPARLRREPARLERQPDDRAEHARAARGDSRARRAGGGGRSAPHRDGRGRRRARVHRARVGSVAVARHAAGRVRGGPRPARALGRSLQRVG